MNKYQIFEHFQCEGRATEIVTYGSGHINDTYRVTLEREDGKQEYIILQRINHEIFKNPVELMENIVSVTSYLSDIIRKQGGNPKRETLNVVLTKEGKPYYKDKEGNYWRSYIFITDALSYDQVEKPEDFFESAVAFGHFQYLLKDYPASTLHETIIGFHDTTKRFARFKEVLEKDICGRAKEVQEEIKFVLEREELANQLGDLQKAGKLPLRVTHNDTKLNNIMMDKDTRKGICVVDLDTVMPGLVVNDFGDSIRFGASTGAEDEKDLSKIWCDLDLYRLYAKGFMQGLKGSLTPMEIKMLPVGASVMTFECGMRFLTDYLEGDVYFKIHKPEHNLDRARTQFKLVADMEAKWDQIEKIIEEECTA